MSREATGRWAEALAAEHLQRRGLTMLTRNYRCRLGEIDIVMRDGRELVFVEVRYRGSEGFGGPGASVDQHKQRRLAAAAAHYLQRAGDDLPARFDVVAVHQGPRIEWIRNAFEVEP